MQAILCHRYGPASLLAPTEAPVPEILPGRILVRVRAASVNAYDWHRVLGEPYFVRLVDGFRGPKNPGVGADVAGVVDAVGEGVTEVRPGDEVFGMSVGTFAEAVLVSGEAVVAKPANLSFEQAAAIPLAATTALQGLRDKGRLQAGERVLVHGAAGGVGHFAVQIAKALGGHVTATTSAAGLDLVRTLGADEVIDYGREDFTQLGRRFDLILDVGGNRSLRDGRRALAPDGRLVICGAPPGRWIAPVVRPLSGAILSRFGGPQLLPFLAHRKRSDLLVLKDLAEAGRLVPMIDRTVPLARAGEAIDLLRRGGVRGKIVISV